MTDHYECGCPGAPRRRNEHSNTYFGALRHSVSSSSLNGSNHCNNHDAPPTGVTRPPAAHVHDSDVAVSRPMHLLRAPSFNPPPFEDEEPPPPLMTPPPNYDDLITGDPRSGLADYFSRLADEIGDEENITRTPSRIDLPLTPGGRINRSMDEQRTWHPIGQVSAHP